MIRFFIGKKSGVAKKSVLGRIAMAMVIVLTIMFSNFGGLKAEAGTIPSYGVTIWTTDGNFVRNAGYNINGAGTSYLTEMKKFYEGENATANIIDGGHLSANSLDGTNLLWVFLPNVNFTADDITYMRNFLATGGRIAFCGEHPGFFATGDGYISSAIASLGGSFTILNQMHAPTVGIATGDRLATGSSLTDGLTGFYYAAAAEISYSGRAQVVLNALDDLPLVVDQPVGKGRITLFTDVNTWDPVVKHESGKGNNEVVFANLMKDAKTNQNIVTAGGDPNIGYGRERVVAPTVNPVSGSLVTAGSTVTFSSLTTGAAIHTTTNLTTPNAGSTTGSSITISGQVGSQVAVKAIASKDGMDNSDVVTFTYRIIAKVDTPTADIANGSTVLSGSTVNLSTGTIGAAIHVTTDLTVPSVGSSTSSAITISGAAGSQVVIKAMATKSGMGASDVVTFTYKIMDKIDTPTSNPISGSTVVSGSTVILSTVTTGTAIHSTTDLTTPNAGSTTGSAITINGAVGSQVVVKAIATKDGRDTSDVATFTYTIATPVVTEPAAISYAGSSDSDSTSSSATTTIKADVINNNTGTSLRGVDAQVITEIDGTKTVTVKSGDAIIFKQPDGTLVPLTNFSKLGFSAITANLTNGSNATAVANVTLLADGTIKVSNLAKGTETQFNATLDLGDGRKIVIGKINIKIDDNGNITLTSTLIDPYGVITDAVTGKVIDGVNMVLYYANTERNKTLGVTPDTIVALPGIEGFKPNDNKNPQISDASGAYGFMVFPTTDYYLVATKDGYNKYTSPTISVEQEIVKWDFKMNNNKTVSGTSRIAGQSRIDTALEIAKATFNGKVSNVVLATSEDYPDALAGSVLAYKFNAPILLAGNTDEDQQKVLDYMKDNMEIDGTVYILGGYGAVNKDMETKVIYSGFSNINRIGGKDRYETAVNIAETVGVDKGKSIILASGEDYPDALSVSSVAAVNQYPILLVNKNEIAEVVRKEIAKINPNKIFVTGLEGVVGSAIKDQVSEITSLDKSNIVRIGGVNRFETSLEIAKYFNLTGSLACISTGNNFADAIAGSLYAAKNNASIILTDNTLSDNEITYLQNKILTGAVIFGGEAAISKDVENQLHKIFGQ